MDTKHSLTITAARPHWIGHLLLAASLSLALTTPLSAAEPTAKPLFPSEEFVGPFANWKNVKTDFGAAGDGKADDTAAIQKTLDQLQQKPGVLFLPAGTLPHHQGSDDAFAHERQRYRCGSIDHDHPMGRR